MAKPKTTPSVDTPETVTPPSDLVTLSRAELALMIAEALQARDDDEPTGPPPGMELAKAIGDAVAAGLEKNNPKKVSYGAYLKRGTDYHPLGFLSPKLSRDYWQNGRLIQYDQVNDAQVELLNRITHSGRYLDRKVEVIVRDTGSGAQMVEIRYANNSLDQRMDNKGLFRNFTELVAKIVAEQDLERADEDENPKRVVRRPFGSGKNTVAAEQAAGV